MKQPFELKALGLNRELSSLRIWAFRIYMLIAIPNAIVAGAETGLAGIIGAVGGVLVLSMAILYVLSSEQKESVSVRQTAD